MRHTNQNASRLAAAPLLALSLIVAGTASADTVELDAARDNTLYSDSDDLSNGAGEHFFAGRTDGGDLRRAPIAFDLDDIPAGSTITGVTLQLRMSRTQAGGEDVSLYRLLTDWGEGASDADGQEGGGAAAEDGDATWHYTFYDTNDPPGAPIWNTDGGDYVGTPSDTRSVSGNGFYTWGSTIEMIADAQLWLDDPGANFGWIVIGNESQDLTAKRFDSRQNGTTSRRPKLTVTFTPPAVPGACCFDGGSCLVLTLNQCTSQGGSYQGQGTDCDPNPCSDPEGACCFDNGSCSLLTMAACTAQNGDYQGDGTNCVPNLCPQPQGACCFDNASCTDLTSDDCTTQGGAYQGDGTTCGTESCPLVLAPFVDALPLPVVAQPVDGVPGGEASYEIAATQFEQQLHRDLAPTTLWGYEDGYPGPTIEATSNLPVTVTWKNDLRDEFGDLRTDHFLPVDECMHGPDTLGPTPRTVVHVHGAHTFAEFDGYPDDWILPGDEQVYIYPNNQLPATIWYHDHALGITRLNVYLGMAGFYLIRDQFELDLDLPAGEFEIPIVIQDRKFDPDGSLIYPVDWEQHFFGDVVLVNGKVWPFLNVKQGKYRFRVISGSGSRTYTLFLSNGATFHQIGTDGGLLRAPVELTEVTLTPAERADIIIDFASYAPGTEIILTNSAPAPFPGSPGEGVVPNVMKFIVTAEAGFTGDVPTELRPIEELEEKDAVQHRDFILDKVDDPCAGSKWLINGLHWKDITEYPELGSTEVWQFINRSGTVHPMHMHLVMFQILDRQAFEVIDEEIVPVGDPIPPAANEAGWKDTVRADPQMITRVIARFDDYLGLFAYHCHILEHEDHEMMRQFRVVAPCPADVNDNGVVGFEDILAILAAWGNAGGPEDVDESGLVGFGDILAVLGAWGPC